MKNILQAKNGLRSFAIITAVYFLLSFITILVRIEDMDYLENFFKPLLMTSLIILLYLNSRFSSPYSKKILYALIFSLAGDILLMPFFDAFIPGLIGFLIAHIFYIRAFLSINKDFFIKGLIKGFPLTLVVMSAYLFLAVFLTVSMRASTADFVLILAVNIYALIITLMVLTTVSFHYVKRSEASALMLTGAVLFMVSDSIIAINKFSSPVHLSGMWVMTSYTLAQWLILFGSLKLIKNNEIDGLDYSQ